MHNNHKIFVWQYESVEKEKVMRKFISEKYIPTTHSISGALKAVRKYDVKRSYVNEIAHRYGGKVTAWPAQGFRTGINGGVCAAMTTGWLKSELCGYSAVFRQKLKQWDLTEFNASQVVEGGRDLSSYGLAWTSFASSFRATEVLSKRTIHSYRTLGKSISQSMMRHDAWTHEPCLCYYIVLEDSKGKRGHAIGVKFNWQIGEFSFLDPNTGEVSNLLLRNRTRYLDDQKINMQDMFADFFNWIMGGVYHDEGYYLGGTAKVIQYSLQVGGDDSRDLFYQAQDTYQQSYQSAQQEIFSMALANPAIAPHVLKNESDTLFSQYQDKKNSQGYDMMMIMVWTQALMQAIQPGGPFAERYLEIKDQSPEDILTEYMQASMRASGQDGSSWPRPENSIFWPLDY